MLRKARVAKINRDINRTFQQIREEINARSQIEFGNFRKSSRWNVTEDGKVLWAFEIDLLSDRPANYIVEYDPKEKQFSCFAKIGVKTGVHNTLQFVTKDKKELRERLLHLARNIPSLRERALREYLYGLSQTRPKRRWRKLFRKDSSHCDYLCEVINELYDQKKISESEKERMLAYAKTIA